MAIRIHPGRLAALGLVLAFAAPGVASAAERPVATTGGVSAVTLSTVTLRGSVNPRGADTTYFFQIGLDVLYGSTTAVTPVGRGNRTVRVSAPVVGLAPYTRYHYRLVARNSQGLTLGRDRTFRTRRQPLGLVMGAAPPVVGVNGSTTLTGQLMGTGNAGRQVVLQAQPWPFTTDFASIGNPLVTDANGAFSFPILAVPLNTRYRVLMPDRPDVVSPIVDVGVVVKVSRRATPRRVSRGRRVRFRGRISPPVDGAPHLVSIQRLVRGVWTTVATTVARRATSTYSTYRRSPRVWRTGTYRVAVNVSDGRYAGSLSRTVKVRVRR